MCRMLECRKSERRESLDACRQSADRTESLEASVVLDAERVNGPRAASLQDVQVTAVRAQRDVVHTTADERGRAVSEETNRAVRCYAEARNRSRPVAGVAEAAIGRYDGPAGRALMCEDGSTDDPDVATPAQCVGRRRARRCRLRHEQQIAGAECEAERRPASRRVRCELTRDTVPVDRIDVEEAGALFGYYELTGVWAERHLRRADVRAGERPRGPRDLRESAGRSDGEASDVPRTARIQDIHDVARDRDADRQRAAGRRATQQ